MSTFFESLLRSFPQEMSMFIINVLNRFWWWALCVEELSCKQDCCFNVFTGALLFTPIFKNPMFYLRHKVIRVCAIEVPIGALAKTPVLTSEKKLTTSLLPSAWSSVVTASVLSNTWTHPTLWWHLKKFDLG